ncbi:MAG TPA: transporter [Pseudonocardiaceae bacterium]|jgi:hypothetical protein|nr:transporter [Pseudonocardiaceae bacterium]
MTRFLLVLAVLAFFVLCAAGMRWGWRNRQRRQSAYLPAFPPPPAELTEIELPELTGVYVSTVTAGDWQDRIAVGDIGHRSAVAVRLAKEGVLLDRVGASPLWIPAAALVDARLDKGMAGKVMGIDGLLVIRWRLGEYELDSGVRGDDKDVYGDWLGAVRALAGVKTGEAA